MRLLHNITLVAALLGLMQVPLKAQEINNVASVNNISADGYIRLTVDNDYFTGTDEQYTEGLNLEIVMPWVRKFPLSYLLVHPRFSWIRYGIGLEQAGYTPNDLPNEGISYGDHPFAATLFLKTFLVATDESSHQRFATTLSTGVMGPAAMAQQFQDNVHVLTNNVWPPGWKYQIGNDAILNYQVNYEKEIFSLGSYLLIDAEATARVGTLNDRAGVGLNLVAGRYQSPYKKARKTDFKPYIYIFDNPEINFVGYDATLQGGLFNYSSPYTLPSASVSRLLFMNRCGLALVIHRFHVEYDEYFYSRQFSGGPSHLFGSLELAVALNDENRFRSVFKPDVLPSEVP